MEHKNSAASFPDPPQLQPLDRDLPFGWRIISLGLILIGLVLVGWGGWLFLQYQIEANKPPPAPIIALTLADVEATETASAITPTPTSTSTKVAVRRKATTILRSTSTQTPTPSPTPTLTSTPIWRSVSRMTSTPTLTPVPTKANPTPTATAQEETPVLSLSDNPLEVVQDGKTVAEDSDLASSSPPTRIIIPAIELDSPVVEVGWSQIETEGILRNIWTVADYAAGWHQNSMLPTQGGNIVMSGHHNIKGEVFRYLVDLEMEDVITLYVGDQTFEYLVQDKFIVKDKGEPEAVRRANAKWIGPFNEERLTLVTCWPYHSNTHRLIIIAKPK